MLIQSLSLFALVLGQAPDTPFLQEHHEAIPVVRGAGGPDGANDVRALAVEPNGNVWAATKKGVSLLPRGKQHWVEEIPARQSGPAFDILAVDGVSVWVAAWDGLHRGGEKGFSKINGVGGPVSTLAAAPGGVYAFGADGVWRVSTEGTATPLNPPVSKNIRAAAADEQGTLWIATGNGLCRYDGKDAALIREGLPSSDVRDVAFDGQGRLWAACMGGVAVLEKGVPVRTLTPADGLPCVFTRCVARDGDGRMWVGTEKGLARHDNGKWALRHSRRWLPDDAVRAVAFDADGTAWVGTSRGVGAIRRKTTTLAEKAAYFQKVLEERHVRPPFIVEKCRLEKPGDLSSFAPEDDDNDGGYTAVYLVMEAYRYAATRSEEARENARRAFDTLDFLQTVTGTPGFFARTVVPSDWKNMKDPGDDFSEEEWAEERVGDVRAKRVPKRWHDSADGKWKWKGDTSSDEATAQFFGFHFYYDLAADDAEKARVAALAARIMDHIIENGYVLRDLDGSHTRWGVWAPERLNDDPEWAGERGINSVEILSYLLATHHMTGNEKYRAEYLRLLRDHNYLENVRRAKNYNPAWRTHIDDELLAMAYPALFKYEKDPEILAVYRESLDHWHGGVEQDQSPFMDYLYALCAGTASDSSRAAEFLRTTPLDLVNWTVDNSLREDLRLVRAPELEFLQTDRLPPADERGVVRWDKNPWVAVQGDGGHSEWAPTFWLLPYWMGRHHGWIAAPEGGAK